MFSNYVWTLQEMGISSRIDRGSEFHMVGTQTWKARWPMHVRVRGWVSRHWSDDLSKRGGTYDVMSDLRFAGWFSESNLYVRVQILNLIRAWMGSQCRLTRICWMGEHQSLRASLAARFWTRWSLELTCNTRNTMVFCHLSSTKGVRVRPNDENHYNFWN